MPRANRRADRHRPLGVAADQLVRVEVRGTTYEYRRLSGATSQRDYRCPSCHQSVPAGVAHIVAWPVGQGGFGGVDERRHWHRQCWKVFSGRSA